MGLTWPSPLPPSIYAQILTSSEPESLGVPCFRGHKLPPLEPSPGFIFLMTRESWQGKPNRKRQTRPRLEDGMPNGWNMCPITLTLTLTMLFIRVPHRHGQSFPHWTRAHSTHRQQDAPSILDHYQVVEHAPGGQDDPRRATRSSPLDRLPLSPPSPSVEGERELVARRERTLLTHHTALLPQHEPPSMNLPMTTPYTCMPLQPAPPPAPS